MARARILARHGGNRRRGAWAHRGRARAVAAIAAALFLLSRCR